MNILADRGETVVLVVGNTAYYGRFGFSTTHGSRYPCPYSGPNLMALIMGDEDEAPAGPVTYPAAFELVH